MKRIGGIIGVVVVLTASTCAIGQPVNPKLALEKALLAEDLQAVQSAVEAGRIFLGNKVGEPEVPDQYRPVPKHAVLLTRAEAQLGFTAHFMKLEKLSWWKIGLDPTKLSQPLRAPASVLVGNVAAVRAKLDGAEQSLAIANRAADFLIWAQEQAGTGVYPFPAARGTSTDRAMEAATSFLTTAERAGRIDEVVRNGWAGDDLGDGGLQFDNGECGVAMFQLFEVTNDRRHLESANKATDWALSRPLCSNWNYNSFSVHLLAKAYAVTKNPKYLEGAILKAKIGVVPGQLTSGSNAGRWIDPHNARPAYHYIMMRALAQLVSVMSNDHPELATMRNSLLLGLKCRNLEMLDRGIMNKDHAIETLIYVHSAFRSDTVFLTESRSDDALNAIGRLVSEEWRRGKAPLGPGAMGLFLEYIVTTSGVARFSEP